MNINDAKSPQRLMVIGAHPDDAEFHAGGLMVRWARGGNKVMILSLTNGAAGHHQHRPKALAKRRREEALTAAARLDAQIQIWNQPDGSLEPSVELRHQLIIAIREFAPDLIVTHRPADYHPDHRAAAQLVQDACFLVQVPNIESEVPCLAAMPPVLYAYDRFTYPKAFRCDWLLDTRDCIDDVVSMLDCHASQVYEWLPHLQNLAVPENRRDWLKQWYCRRPQHVAQTFAQDSLTFAEAYEVSEYGGAFQPPTWLNG